MDFIVKMPIADGHDVALTITDLCSKKVMIGSGKEDWGGAEWAPVVLDLLADWGVPAAIISDRDPRFMSDFWATVWKIKGTTIQATTAWHPQVDGQSERTNLTVEIALRYHMFNNPTANWVKFLPQLRSIFKQFNKRLHRHIAGRVTEKEAPILAMLLERRDNWFATKSELGDYESDNPHYSVATKALIKARNEAKINTFELKIEPKRRQRFDIAKAALAKLAKEQESLPLYLQLQFIVILAIIQSETPHASTDREKKLSGTSLYRELSRQSLSSTFLLRRDSTIPNRQGSKLSVRTYRQQ